jgi:hypothetical protein
MPFRHHIGSLGQRLQCGPIGLGADGDHLAVSAWTWVRRIGNQPANALSSSAIESKRRQAGTWSRTMCDLRLYPALPGGR